MTGCAEGTTNVVSTRLIMACPRLAVMHLAPGTVSELHQSALRVLGRGTAGVVVTWLSSSGCPQRQQRHHLSVRPPHQLRPAYGESSDAFTPVAGLLQA